VAGCRKASGRRLLGLTSRITSDRQRTGFAQLPGKHGHLSDNPTFLEHGVGHPRRPGAQCHKGLENEGIKNPKCPGI
jgi:hypothetical protein